MMFFAAFASAIPAVSGLTAKEQQLIKLFIFPLVFRCLCNSALDKKILPTLKHGNIWGYVAVCFVYGYCYGTEWYSNVPAMQKMIDNWGHFGISEKMEHVAWNIFSRGTRGGYRS